MIIKSKLDLALHADSLYTAYHEAGHAIYSLLHYMRVTSVCVFKNKNKEIEGFCDYNYPKNLEDIKDKKLLQKQLKYEIGIDYAGLIAEKHYFKMMSGSDKFPIYLRGGSAADTLSAAELIKNYSGIPAGAKRYAYKQKLMKETKLEIEKHWDAVTAVAHALFKKKRLNFKNLKNILIKKTDDKEFWKEQFKEIDAIYNNIDLLDEKILRTMI